MPGKPDHIFILYVKCVEVKSIFSPAISNVPRLTPHKNIFIFLSMQATHLDFDPLLEALRAAGEPTRLRLIALLRDGELTVGEIAEVLNQSQPRVSRHLKLL